MTRTVPRKGDRVRIVGTRWAGRECVVVVADNGGEVGVDIGGRVAWFLRRELELLS